MLDKQADWRNRVRQQDNTREAPLSKILIPIGPFCYGEISLMPLVTGWVGDTEEDAIVSR